MAAQGFHEAKERVLSGQRRPGGDGAVTERALGVADQQGRAGALLHAQSLARRAPA